MKKLMIAAMAAAMAFNAQALITRTTVQQGEIEGVEHEGAALYKKIPWVSCAGRLPCLKKHGQECTRPTSGATVRRSP